MTRLFLNDSNRFYIIILAQSIVKQITFLIYWIMKLISAFISIK